MAARGIIAAIGECMVELSPAGTPDEALLRQGFAGDTFNTAWYLRALLPASQTVRYVSAVGVDAMSTRMLDFMAEHGVDTSHIGRLPGRTPGLYLITLTAGERSFTYWRSASAARSLADDPARLKSSLAGCRLAYLSGITLAILPASGRENLLAALGEFRAGGGLVAFDPNIRPALWPDAATMRAGIAAGYASADIALPTFEDDAALFGDATPEGCAHRIAALGPYEIVVKNGPAPALLHSAGRQSRLPLPRVVTPVDTTAAGDSFNAGWLAARLAGASATEAVLAGQRLSARVILHRGALMPMREVREPSRDGREAPSGDSAL